MTHAYTRIQVAVKRIREELLAAAFGSSSGSSSGNQDKGIITQPAGKPSRSRGSSSGAGSGRRSGSGSSRGSGGGGGGGGNGPLHVEDVLLFLREAQLLRKLDHP